MTAYKTIYLAGGCFWGVEAYFRRIDGTVSTVCGYANGHTVRPGYREVCTGSSGHVETVCLQYDPVQLPIQHVLAHFFRLIDPVSLNRQGNDCGSQYRTGIYYVDPADEPIVRAALKRLQRYYRDPVVVECLPLTGFYPAEAEHQNYLNRNPQGYCHIDLTLAAVPLSYAERHPERLDALDDTAFAVTQQAATERPFSHPYCGENRRGVYVDIVSGVPLFWSDDKFDSGCGWPAFSRPLSAAAVAERRDFSHGMVRTEILAGESGAHLGHVFPDGPSERGGLRYCINGAALRFVAEEDWEKEGLGYLKSLRTAEERG